MAAEPWRPTPHLAYHAGVLRQKWMRDCSDYAEYGGQLRRRTWVEEEWRDIREMNLIEIANLRAAEPQGDEHGTNG